MTYTPLPVIFNFGLNIWDSAVHLRCSQHFQSPVQYEGFPSNSHHRKPFKDVSPDSCNSAFKRFIQVNQISSFDCNLQNRSRSILILNANNLLLSMIWKHPPHLSSSYYIQPFTQKSRRDYFDSSQKPSHPSKLTWSPLIGMSHTIFIICHVKIIKQMVYEPLN